MAAGRSFLGPWPPAVNFRERTASCFKRAPLFNPIELDDSSSRHQQEKKRRLTADQVEFLEKSFDHSSENKLLEPARKFHLAEVLGVEPRQIAIWFQNRRARWRTKQLEKDCESLRSSYDSLKADHECLLKEKQILEAKVLFLTEKLLLKERPNGGSDPFEVIEHPESTTVQESGRSPPCADEDGRYCSMLMDLTGSANALEFSNFDRSQLIGGEVVDDASDYAFLGLQYDSLTYELLWS